MRPRVVAVSLIVILGLSACTTGAPVADATTSPTPTPTATTTPAPTATTTFALASVPADCATVVDAATYSAAFGETPLNDPGLGYTDGLGAVPPTATPAGAAADEAVDAATQLRCIWRYPQADITYLQLQIGSVAAGVADDYLKSLKLSGHTCDETLGGTRCTLTGTDPQYQVDTAETSFVRGDVVIRIDQANFPTDNLLGAVVARVWSD